MTELKIKVSCANCDEDIYNSILDFTGEGVFDVDMMIEGEVFDCNRCGGSTGVMLMKESFNMR